MGGSIRLELVAALIRNTHYSVTPASVHDRQVIDELLDHSAEPDGNNRAVYADSAYRSQDQEHSG